MRYNIQEFNKSVGYYKKNLPRKAKNIFFYGNFNKDAFFSIAPLSRAADELGIDMYVALGHNTRSYETLFGVWECYKSLKRGLKNEKTESMKEFFKEAKIKELERFFKKPDIIIKSDTSHFSGDINLEYNTAWFNPFMESELRQTTDSIIKNIFTLKKNEMFSIGFVLIPNKNFLENPMQDYLDSYPVCYSMFLSSSNACSAVTVKSSTKREGQRDNPEMVSELSLTLLGLELEKDINMPVFKKYKLLSKALGIKIDIPQAAFFVSEKGYHGKHIFGEKIGYPTKNMKTKWNVPNGIIYKFEWYPQSWEEDRDPKSRVSFTSTVPIERLIEATLVDYSKMRKRNRQIGSIMEKCDKVIVKTNIENGCDFEVGLIKKDGSRRNILYSDSDTTHIINQRILKENGKKMGCMGNIPGGEAFTTPSYVKGRIVGDVVINIDRSHRLSKENLFVAEAYGHSYKIISGPVDVIMAFEKRKKESWKNILEQEKSKSLDKNIIALKKKNFNSIGEFAINTNPNARLCDYLIINEKIAKMIHIAFGSGFEADTATEYHMDVVIDSPRQKLDIYGIDKYGNELWIIKNGDFVV